MFRLTKNYSIASLVGIAIVATALGYFYWGWAYDNLQKQEIEANTNLTRAISNTIWPRYAAFVQRASTLSKEELINHPRNEALRNELVSKLRGLRIAKVKIYNLDGLTVFSTDSAQIGESKRNNEGFLLAKSGGIASEITYRNQFSHYDRIIEDRNVLSSYIPIRQSNSNKVEGVFEVYSDVTPYIDEINATQIHVITTVASLLTMLYLALLFYIRKADNLIQQYRREELEHAKFYDLVTALPNRHGFEHLLEREVTSAKERNKLISVFSVNIDRFKFFNESMGHKEGDKLLCEFGKRLQGCVRREDIVCRSGADEFYIIVKSMSSVDQVIRLADRMMNLLSQPITINGDEIILTVSAGIAFYPLDTDESSVLAKHATAAMLKAKRSGGNQYFFYTDGLNTEIVKRFKMEIDLRTAIKNKEFLLYYQPRISLDNGRVLGMEALIRWQAVDGMVMPGDFIPVLEDTDMILEVGEWILNEACVQCKTWHNMGYSDLRVSVNLSARQFMNKNIINHVRTALSNSGLPPDCLELEITESILAEDIQHTITILGELKLLGIYLSIDDFGTGYSSLSYLMYFPIDYLKIDREFIKDVTGNQNHANLARAIIAMGQSLGMETVAEGIEDNEQLDFISKENCNEAQGFLFSKPLPAGEFIQKIDEINKLIAMPQKGKSF